MARFSRLIMAGAVAAFATWCALSLRADVSHISFYPLRQSWNLFVFAMALTFLNYTLRVGRWRWHLSRLGHRVPIGFAALTYIAGFAFTLSPAKLGELVRARYYVPIGIPLQDVFGAFWAERLMDLTALCVLSVLILRNAAGYSRLIWLAASAIAAGAALIALLPSQALARLLCSPSRIPRVVAQPVAQALNSFRAARSLLRPGPIALGLLISLIAWGLEGIGLGIVASAISPDQKEGSIAVGTYAIAVLVGALSFLPGGLGSTETVMTALLTSQGYSVANAILTTLMCRFTTLWLGVCLGWIAVIQLRRRQEPRASTSLMELRKWPSEP